MNPAVDKNKNGNPVREWLTDPSLLTLLGSNLVTIVVAVVENWRVWDVVWIYWSQSVTIGWFSWLRMRHLKRFSSDGLKIGGAPVPMTAEGARMAANLLGGTNAFFHAGYLFWLVILASGTWSRMTRGDLIAMALCTGSFIINHWFSYRHNLEADLTRKPNIGNIGCLPLARVMPMHLTIIFCGGLSSLAGPGSRIASAFALIFFLGLKTLADVFMHAIEHQDREQGVRLGQGAASPRRRTGRT